MYAIVYDEYRQRYEVVMLKKAEKYDYLTIIETSPTYAMAQKKLKDLNKTEQKGGGTICGLRMKL